MIEAGFVFYTRTIQYAPTSRRDKGHKEIGFGKAGLLLGVCLGFSKEGTEIPKGPALIRLAANAGYVKLDDIQKCLGEEAVRKMEDYLLETYPCGEDEDARKHIDQRRNDSGQAADETTP